jgi:hypothetical protein
VYVFLQNVSPSVLIFIGFLVGKPEGERPVGRLDSIKIDLREIGWGCMDQIDPAQVRDQWRPDIIRSHEKGLNKLEKYHIYKISKRNLHMNDTNIDTQNPIFRTLQEMNTS